VILLSDMRWGVYFGLACMYAHCIADTAPDHVWGGYTWTRVDILCLVCPGYVR
jgi:hypothetical protein